MNNPQTSIGKQYDIGQETTASPIRKNMPQENTLESKTETNKSLSELYGIAKPRRREIRAKIIEEKDNQ
jgi:hypothetical protein